MVTLTGTVQNGGKQRTRSAVPKDPTDFQSVPRPCRVYFPMAEAERLERSQPFGLAALAEPSCTIEARFHKTVRDGPLVGRPQFGYRSPLRLKPDLVRLVGLEPTLPKELGFESSAASNYATTAKMVALLGLEPRCPKALLSKSSVSANFTTGPY